MIKNSLSKRDEIFFLITDFSDISHRVLECPDDRVEHALEVLCGHFEELREALSDQRQQQLEEVGAVLGVGLQ